MAAVTPQTDEPNRRSIQELEDRQAEIKAELKEIDAEYQGVSIPEGQRTRWNALTEEHEKNDELVRELKARNEHLRNLSQDPANREGGAEFHTGRPGVTRGEDIYDLTTVRATSSPQDATRELRDRAMRSVETAVFPHDRANPEHVRTHIARLIDKIDGQEQDIESPHGQGGHLARRILTTGSPLYRRAFSKYLSGRGMTAEEQRALSLGTTSAGGFAVVYTLDPTVVPTSNFSVNPFRAIARVETIAGTNEWKALTSGAITAAYAAEATEASDNAPTLAQPDIIVEKAQAFVPFSIELGQDWGALQSEMAALLQDAKDDLEATKFAVGAGHGSTEPKGVITGATATTTAGGTAAFAIADLYKLFEALPARFRPRAQWVANLFTYDKVRQFDTAGGSGVWVDAQDGTRGLGPAVGAQAAGAVNGNIGPRLLGKPAWESTAMAAALTTASKILIVGDWRYFVIVDRIGMDIEILPHLLGSNRRPTGQRGLYAYWRNSSDVLSASAFQVLVTG